MSKTWIALIAGIVLPVSAAAQDEWEFRATVNGWFAGVSTTLDTPQGELEAEVDFDEVLEALDLAFLSSLEARKGRWSFIGDLDFFDLSAEVDTPFGNLFSQAEVGNELTLFSAYAAYAVVDGPRTRVDLGGGLRYYDTTIETRLTGQGETPDLSFTDEADWTDLVIAARVNHRFTDKWYGVSYLDLGGFGIEDSSELTWQGFAAVGYQFNDRWSALGGYQHLSIDREFDRTDIEAELSGPYLGIQVAF